MFLKTDLLKGVCRLPVLYWILILIRIALTLAPQVGYLHPDEFFQNVDVIAADVFTIDITRIWEFDPKFALRNMLVPIMIFGPPLYFLRVLDPYARHYLGISLRTPYYLLVAPRFFVCLLSFINDYCIYRICVLYGQHFRNRLVIFASSYVVLVYCCRNFSNALEMIFFSVQLLLVSKCMLRSDKFIDNDPPREKFNKASSPEKLALLHLPEHSLNPVVLLSALVVVGVFSRPTFVGFALPSIYFWLLFGSGSKSKLVSIEGFHRLFIFILCGLPPALLLILVDSIYYGSLTMTDVQSMTWSWDKLVVTPLNFVKYNMNENNLAKHGLHPRWQHLVFNMPLLFGQLTGVAFITLTTNTYRLIRGDHSKWPRIQSITSLMLLSLVVPLAMLSLFPHQEARFIIPVLVPLVYLYGDKLHPNDSNRPNYRKLKKTLLYTWFILNAALTIFFGFVHQGGIYPFAKTLYREIKSTDDIEIHIVITHSYSMPKYLLQRDSTTKVRTDRQSGRNYTLKPTTFFYEYGSSSMEHLFTKVHDILTKAEIRLREYKKQYRFYVATSCSLESTVEEQARKYFYFKLVYDFKYYPHFSSEAPPKFPSRRDQYCIESRLIKTNGSSAVDLNMFRRILCYFKKFCLKVYRVYPKNT